MIPLWPYLSEFKQADRQYKERTKEDFDRGHRVRDLPDLPDDQSVWVSSPEGPVLGTVVSPAVTLRSYIVKTESDEVRQNRCQLRIRPDPDQHNDRQETSRNDRSETTRTSLTKTRSRTGVSLKAPDRLY